MIRKARAAIGGVLFLGFVVFGIMLIRDRFLQQQVTNDMVLIPAGEFTMGLTREQYHEIRDWEKDPRMTNVHPGRIVWLDDYYIDRYEVTVRDYQTCVSADGCVEVRENVVTCTVVSEQCTTQPDGRQACEIEDVCEGEGVYTDVNEAYYYDPQYADYPMANVTWDQARRYCDWRGDRLPTEAEWEKAARGTDGRYYPWGNEWRSEAFSSINSEYPEMIRLAPGGVSPEAGASPYGVLNMIGGVREWTADAFYSYEDPAAPPPEDLQDTRIVRGGIMGLYVGSGIAGVETATVVHRLKRTPTANYNIGFRCVEGDEPPPIADISRLVPMPYRDQPNPEPLPLPDESVVLIPAGEFLFGTLMTERFRTGEPISVSTDAYYITELEVSFPEYAEFLAALGGNELACYKEYCTPAFTNNELSFKETLIEERDRLGAIKVTWYGAYAYCQWRGGRLPTEIELEKADLPTRIDFGPTFEHEWTGEKFQEDYPSSTSTLVTVTNFSETPPISVILRDSDEIGRAAYRPSYPYANFRCVFPQ